MLPPPATSAARPSRSPARSATIHRSPPYPDTLQAFGDTVGITIEYSGDADWEDEHQDAGRRWQPTEHRHLPAARPARGLRRRRLDRAAQPPQVDATVDENWDEDYQVYGQYDGVQYGVPVKTDLKSLVWYVPSAFEAAGYEVPTTFDEFTALIDQIKADGNGKPLCVGIESGGATGWPFTDWVEEMVLRQSGGDVYDQWVQARDPVQRPADPEAMQTVIDLWSEDNVYASGGSIAATAFQDNGQPLLDGDCWMHRQANFFAGLFPEGTTFADGADGSVDVFYFPDINGDKPVLTAGTYAAGFNDDPATMAVLELHGHRRLRLRSDRRPRPPNSVAACPASCRPPRTRTRACTSRSSRSSSTS